MCGERLQIPESTLRSFSFACEEVVIGSLGAKQRGSLRGRGRGAVNRACGFKGAGVLLRCFFAVFFWVLFAVCFFLLLDASKAILESNMAPTWGHFGAMLGKFSDMFGCCFGSFT